MGDWSWLKWLVALVAAILVVRATVWFNLNEWFRDRRKRNEENLRLLCPHVTRFESGGAPAVRSTYVSPSGTTACQWQLCGDTTYDEAWIDEVARYWASNPNELVKRHRKTKRLSKRLGRP